jgi:hypothetical protein
MAAPNPVLSILNMPQKAPASMPQASQPTVQGPTAVNLTATPAPTMTPTGPGVMADLPASTTSLDLPASLQGLLGSGSPQVAINEPILAQQSQQFTQTGTVASNPNAPALDFRLQPTYAEGGMVGQNGMPVAPAGMGGQEQAPMSPQMLEMQLQDFMRKNPQQVQQIAQAVMAGFQSGEITPDELNMANQLAMTALQNPEMYQYVRKYAIQQGLATEQDLSPNYDQGLIFVLLLAVRSVQQQTGGMGAVGGMGTQTGAPPQPMMSMADGGYVKMGDNARNGGKVVGPGTGTSDSIPIRVSAGEYVIPAKVVQAKGKDFFDSLLKKYKDA